MDRPGLQVEGVEAARHLKSVASEPLGFVAPKDCQKHGRCRQERGIQLRGSGIDTARWATDPRKNLSFSRVAAIRDTADFPEKYIEDPL